MDILREIIITVVVNITTTAIIKLSSFIYRKFRDKLKDEEELEILIL